MNQKYHRTSQTSQFFQNVAWCFTIKWNYWNISSFIWYNLLTVNCLPVHCLQFLFSSSEGAFDVYFLKQYHEGMDTSSYTYLKLHLKTFCFSNAQAFAKYIFLCFIKEKGIVLVISLVICHFRIYNSTYSTPNISSMNMTAFII